MPETFTEVHNQLNISKARDDERERWEADQRNARQAVRRYCKFHVKHGEQQAAADQLMEVLGL